MAFGPWSNEVTASTRFSGTWINDPDNPAETVIRLRYGGVGRQNSRDRAKTALQFVGRSFPVYDVGDARAQSLNVDAVLSSEDGDAEQQMAMLEQLIGDGEVILYRDARGRKMYAMGTDFQAEDLEMGSYHVTFLLNRVDFDESIPEPTDTPSVPIDIQPKNLVVNIDQPSRVATLDWDDVVGAQLYHIFLNGIEVGSTSESATTYGPLDPGEYVFYVTALVAGSVSPPSSTAGITVLPGDDPGGPGGDPPTSIIPPNFRAFPQADKTVPLQWDPVPGATEYRVEEIRSPNGVSNGITTSTTMTRGPLGDGPFDYWVRAKVNGVWSGESNHQQFTLPYDGGPIGGGPGGGGDPGVMPSPVEVLGIKNGDAGYLHYNIGVGFKTGHEDIFVQTLEDWSAATRDKLANNMYTIIDAAGKYAVYMTVDPDGGTTSANTQYPRAEFREMQQTDSGNANKASWGPGTGDHDFSGFSRIMSLPPGKPGVCINQLHDASDDTVMIKTVSLSGKIAVVLDVFGARVQVLNPDYKVGREIYSRLRILNGNLTVYYSESTSNTTSAVPPASPVYTQNGLTTAASGWYHKFGCYAQSNESTDTTGTKCVVQVRDWKQWHTGWPTPVTGNYAGPGTGTGTAPVVSAGADATVAPGQTFTRTGIVQGAGITAQGWRLIGSAGSTDPNTAAGKLNWGAQLDSSDEFNYSGAPDATKWSVYNSPGHAGNGVRSPARISVANGKLTITGLAGSANTGGMAHKTERQYGKWEIRARSYYTSDPNAPGDKDGGYHPVAIIWPSDGSSWPYGGEYDFLENGEPGEPAAGSFLHYPSLDGENHQIEVPSYPVNQREFHNYAIEWTSSFLKLYVDGNLWYTASGGAAADRKAIQAMLEGNLTLQLDAFQETGLIGSAFEIEWVRLYPLVPVTSNPALSSSTLLNWTAPTVPGNYTLEFWATNAQGTTTDQMTVTVSTSTGGGTPTPGTLVYPETFPDNTPYSTFGAAQNVVNVSGSAALTSALANAQPGQIITLGSGNYSGTFTASKKGTSAQGIIIRAATRLGAVFAAGSKFIIKDAEFTTVDGLDFPFDGEGDVLQIRGAAKNVQFRRCRVGPSSFSNNSVSGNYVYVGDDVKHFRIGYCTFRNKGTSGNVVRVYGNFTSFVGCQYGRIDHNLVDTVGDEVGNDKEVFRIGVSTMSRTVGNHIVERNVIINAKAEPEVISGKMASVWQRGNVVLRCAGGIVIRHGRNCKQLSNYVIDRVNTTATAGLKSGGSRFYDSGHEISDNYFDGLASTANFQHPIQIDSGDADPSSTSLSNHFNVIDCDLRRNVVINCAGGIFIGDNYSTAPASTDLVDNDVVNSGGVAVTNVGGMTMTGDSTVSNNVHYASAAAGGYVADADGIFRKTGRGPKVKYLTAAMVGVDGDLDELDRTGAAV